MDHAEAGVERTTVGGVEAVSREARSGIWLVWVWIGLACWVGTGCQPGGGKDMQGHLAPPPVYASAVSPQLSWAGGMPDSAPAMRELVSDLSPVQLLVSQATELTLFGGGTNGVDTGAGAPRYLALKHADTQHVFTNAATVVITNLNEGWLMVWGFGLGSLEADVPWAVYLQHAPKQVQLDARGLHLTFHGPMGWVGWVPLYGREFLATTPAAFAARKLDPKVHPKIWEWAKVVPREPLSRARLWASSLSAWPVSAWISMEEGKAHGRFEGMELPREWHPAHLKLAPLDERLSEVMRLQPQSLKFSSEAFDLQMGTNGMTWWGVMQSDRYTVTGVETMPRVWQEVREKLKEATAGGVEHERWRSWSFETPPGSGGRRMSRLEWVGAPGDAVWPVIQVMRPAWLTSQGGGGGLISMGQVRVGGRGGFRGRETRMLTPNVSVTDYR